MISDICISSDVSKAVITIRSSQALRAWSIVDSAGHAVDAPVIRNYTARPGEFALELDARDVAAWSPDHPVLYYLDVDGERIRFGHCDIRAVRGGLLVNGAPFFARGYIRGITAHDHPNMTGLSKAEYFRKNIMQAKKYGFNLVRFHSTIPDEEFMALADELGLFVHLEVGYNYEFDANGHKKKIVMDRERWRDTILRDRNHPSLAIFCLGNEMHNSGRVPEAQEMYAVGRALAPHKLIMDNAGWGEFDRGGSDIFAQHIAYYFPFKTHAAMFDQDFCWEMNGLTSREPVTASRQFTDGEIRVRRQLNPVRPVIAHECVHYSDIPDYAELNRRFDAFAAKVGPEYLTGNGIEKPRYLTELPELVASKKLDGKMPDYILASRHFKKLAIKTYLERLRLSSKLCGFEMLQLSDCLKYENKNGIIDSYDDDKFIDAEWRRQFTSDAGLRADYPKENGLSGEELRPSIHLSNFGGGALTDATLTLVLATRDGHRETLFRGAHFSPVSGLSKLVDITLTLGCRGHAATEYTLEAELTAAGQAWRNQWSFWVYPPARLAYRPDLRVSDAALSAAVARLGEGAMPNHEVLLSDRLDGATLASLESGKTVILNYHRDRQGNHYLLPGALDRFKPCIWDRGSHLGGVVAADWLQKALGSGRYFDKNLYHLVEAAFKVNLDHFPSPVEELAWGVDKPVRDRMKGLIHGIKNFLPDDTLRNFSYLFNVRVGAGRLIVCTFNLSCALADPASSSVLCALVNAATTMDTACAVDPSSLRKFLVESTAAGVVREDVMNHFWEIDNKPVEDTLFWEQAMVDLRKMKPSVDTQGGTRTQPKYA